MDDRSSVETSNNHATEQKQRTKAGKVDLPKSRKSFGLFQTGRVRRFRMADSRQNGVDTQHNGVELKGYTREEQSDELNLSLKEALNGEQERKESIVGPTGTVRGIKNIIRERQNAFLFNANGNYRAASEEVEVDDFAGKIIYYTTSMGGIRSTVDDCRFVKKLFDNLNVEVDERDIFIHKEHQQELDRRLEMEKGPVPQVFVNGVCLGGKEELLHLNETGQLKELLTGFKKLNGPLCSQCGGFRYVNCLLCNGSKRVRRTRMAGREITFLKCTKCNENGLLRCPECVK